MSNIRIPIAICAAVADVLNGSHDTLNALFETAGAPGPPPDLAHHSKWKIWLQKAGNDPEVDSLAVLGNIIEEFMDLPPVASDEKSTDFLGIEHDPIAEYNKQRERLVTVLEEHGFRYFRGGRVLPIGIQEPEPESIKETQFHEAQKPSSVEELLKIILTGLPRAMHPFTHRRKKLQVLSFDSEYDIQDLLHSQLRPWIADIRPEEFTPSYAGSNTRMDFLLPMHKLVIETKRVRDKSHASKVGDELIIDIEHYRRHPKAEHLWCVIYDPQLLILNPKGLSSDLEGNRRTADGSIQVKVFIFGGSM